MTGASIKRVGLFLLAMSCATAAYAQVNFVNYQCADGTQVVAAFSKGDNRMRVQFDGHSHTLPQRLSASGARYASSGVSFWIKGQEATLKRPKAKATLCKAV
jgi:membrane-bound inhibitor of C-type lysozyme